VAGTLSLKVALEDVGFGRKTSRADLADFMLQQLTTDEYVQKAVAIATFV
jgi:hypothetical protein